MPASHHELPHGAHSDSELRLVGLGVSPGIAQGPLLLGEDVFEEPELQEVDAGAVPGELQRFEEALAVTRDQIRNLQIQVEQEIGSDDAAIFDAHLLMLEDRTVLEEVRNRIRSRPQQAEGAFYGVMSRYIENLRKIDDDYLRERTLDFEDVARRVVRNLMGKAHGAAHDRPHILLVHELTPSAAASMDRSKVLGLITEAGSHTSHGAIIARSMGIPAVVGLHDAASRFHSGGDSLVDGYQGIFIFNPSEDTVAGYEVTKRQKSALTRHLGEMREAPAITRDGRKLILSANIEFESEMPQVTAAGAEGVGLYRTEFFYLNRRDLPGEQEQAENYSRVAAAAGPQGVIIRTLDIGGDKLHHHMHRGIEESNPFLGWRGIRVSLTERELFKTQLRAALRASRHGKVRLMFPMISGIEELREARGVLTECQHEFIAEGIPFDPKIEVGCMIEIPSAAVIADSLAREVDFFSIGTNDLIQYTIAVDRGNDRVSSLYQPCHPAIVRLLKTVADASRAAGIWTGVCGEMAGDISLTPLLIGLGFEELSVASVQLPMVKYAVRKLEAAACDHALADALKLSDADHIYERIRETSLEYYPELFA